MLPLSMGCCFITNHLLQLLGWCKIIALFSITFNGKTQWLKTMTAFVSLTDLQFGQSSAGLACLCSTHCQLGQLRGLGLESSEACLLTCLVVDATGQLRLQRDCQPPYLHVASPCGPGSLTVWGLSFKARRQYSLPM